HPSGHPARPQKPIFTRIRRTYPVRPRGGSGFESQRGHHRSPLKIGMFPGLFGPQEARSAPGPDKNPTSAEAREASRAVETAPRSPSNRSSRTLFSTDAVLD